MKLLTISSLIATTLILNFFPISSVNAQSQNIGVCWLRETADVPDPSDSYDDDWIPSSPKDMCFYYPFKFAYPTYYEIETNLLSSKKLVATSSKPGKGYTKINGKPGVIFVRRLDFNDGDVYVTYCFRVNGAKKELCIFSKYSSIGYPPPQNLYQP